VVRPVSPKVSPRDFAFAAGHCRIAVSLVASTLNSHGLLDGGGFIQRLGLAQRDGFLLVHLVRRWQAASLD
jgi:hypothetical protein